MLAAKNDESTAAIQGDDNSTSRITTTAGDGSAKKLSEQEQNLRRDQVLSLLQTVSAGVGADALHRRALREWMTLFILYQEDVVGNYGVAEEEDDKGEEWEKEMAILLQLHLLRATLTSGHYTTRPGLVGNAFYCMGRVVQATGDRAKALQCYKGVYNDLCFCLGQFHSLPRSLRFEVFAICYWLEQACTGILELQEEPAGNAAVARDLDEVKRLRADQSLPNTAGLFAQFGPIAQTYLEPTKYLSSLLGELRAVSGDDDIAIFSVAERYDYCRDIDFYHSAMGSYYSARPMLQSMGVTTTYDTSHQEVFAAVDDLERRRQS